MIPRPILGFVLLCSLLSAGCTDRRAQAEKAQEDAEAKARADAARNEMKTLPKTFQTPDYFKKNEPAAPKPAPTKSQTPEQKK